MHAFYYKGKIHKTKGLILEHNLTYHCNRYRNLFSTSSSIIYYSKNSYIRTLNFEGQAANGSYLVIMISNIRFLNRFLIYETLDVHDNLHFY